MRLFTSLTPKAAGAAALVGASALAAALLAAEIAPPAGAAEEPSPLVRHLEGLQVGPGIEHRLLVVHPLFAPKEDAGAAGVQLAFTVAPDTLGIPGTSANSRAKLRLQNLGQDKVLLVPGCVVRTQFCDHVATQHVVVPKGTEALVPVVRATRDLKPADAPLIEASVLGPVLPPALRWIDLGEARPGELAVEAGAWADQVELTTPRRSPAELRDTKLLAARVADYRQRLGVLPRGPSAAGRELVGYAALLDGGLAAIETFGNPRLFSAAWPKLLDGIAVEAALLEDLAGLLTEDLPESSEPDRFTAEVKKRMLALYAASPVTKPAREEGTEYLLRLDHADARAIVLEDHVAHFVLLTDPDHRRKEPGEELDPGVIGRKSRPTEAERRWLDRRAGRSPPPPAPPPPR